MNAPPLQPRPIPPRPHWTEPVSREETLARREKFQRIGWLPPNHKPKTKKGIATAKRLWDKYCEHIDVDADSHLLEGQHHDFESWIDWIHRTTKKKTHDSISVYWKWLCQAYSALAKHPMDCFTTEQVRRYLNGQMHEDHDVSRQARQKDTLSAEDLGILLQWHWKYGTATFTNERQRVQLSLLMLFSAFTGSRPDALLGEDDSSSKNSRKSLINDSSDNTLADNSDEDTLVDDGSESNAQSIKRPGTVCYGDIELFLLRNPDNPERDILMAEVNFRNLKGRAEGADGTKFLMHEDYQLAYCPLAHITSLAFADDAFENSRLTPELLHKLRVPGRLHVLPLRFKKSMSNTPIFRGTVKTVSGVHTHPTRIMLYRVANEGLKRLGELAGYRYPIHYYCFRRWVANESNRHFTERERNRILGHSGSAIFEKYYHDNRIHRDIQNVVLLRPSQEHLCRAAAQMNRHRDHLAPSDLTEDQLEGIKDSDEIRRLRKQRLTLRDEIRALYGTLKKAKDADPDRYREHETLVKELARVRAIHRRERKAEFRQDYFETMPVEEIDKQIDQLLGESSDIHSADVTEEWNPPIPEYPFVERARIADAFFGPDAESTDGEKTLTRRIQVVSDLTALCKMRQQCRRGKPFNWNKVDETVHDTITHRDNEDIKTIKRSPPSSPTSPPLSSDQCPFCFFDDSFPPADRMRRYARIDSLRRHVLRIHLNQASRHDYGLRGLPQPCSRKATDDGPIICPEPACGGLVLESQMHYMSHSAKVHKGPF